MLRLEACRAPEFWRWLKAAYDYVFLPLERLRRWGLVCPCCQRLRDDGTYEKVECVKAGRRLHQAWAKIVEVCDEFRDRSVGFSADECGGSLAIYGWLLDVFRYIPAMLRARFSWINIVPWVASRANTVEGAARFLSTFKASPLEHHDEPIRLFAGEFEDELESVAGGAAPSPRLNAAVASIQNTPLHENPGEAYHRATHYFKNRSSSALLPYVKSSVRHTQNIKLGKKLLKTRARGRNIFRFEWFRCKRVLRTGKKRQFVPCRISDRAFFRRLYRMDSRASEDWGDFVNTDGGFPGPAKESKVDREERPTPDRIHGSRHPAGQFLQRTCK